MTKENSGCCGPNTEDRKDDTSVADETVRTQVREAYAQVAQASTVDPAAGRVHRLLRGVRRSCHQHLERNSSGVYTSGSGPGSRRSQYGPGMR